MPKKKGRKVIYFQACKLPRGIHRRVRLAAVRENIPVYAWIARACQAFIDRGKKPEGGADAHLE